MNKAVFLDRDGTINVDKDYIYKVSDFEFMPRAVEALKMLQDHGFVLIVITNQSGIARGFYTEKDYRVLNEWMLDRLHSEGVDIAATYYCPHHPDASVLRYRMNCDCRKPLTGLFERAIGEHDIDIGSSFAIGDRLRDCGICKRGGCKGYLIGENEETETIQDVMAGKVKNVKYKNTLYECALEICDV